MHNTILQRVKKFLTVKMVNLEKIKKERFQPSPLLLRRPAPATYLQPHILIFQHFSPSGEYTYKEFLKNNF